MQYKPGLSLRSKAKLLVPDDGETHPSEATVQSACFLHLNYSYDLDKELAAGNCFYALHEIFLFTAF